MGFVNHEFNAHQGQSLRTGGHIRQEDVTKEPIKCQTVKKLHHTESFPPASRKTTRKLICLKLDSELKKKKKSLWKSYHLYLSLMELGISHIYFILPTWSKNPQPDIES